jgi:hypothetical protein
MYEAAFLIAAGFLQGGNFALFAARLPLYADLFGLHARGD